jgi:hypothetical protein
MAKDEGNFASKAAASMCSCNGPNWVGVVHTAGPLACLTIYSLVLPKLFIYDMKYD